MCIHTCKICNTCIFLADKPLASSEAGSLYNPSSKIKEAEKQTSDSPKQLSTIEKLSVSYVNVKTLKF